MSGAKVLFEVQELDTQIDSRGKRLSQILRQLEGDAELIATRRELERLEAVRKDLQDQQQSVEWDVETTRERISLQEARMLGNQVSNPRELQSIEREVGHLKERQRSFEDRVLALMEEIEQNQVPLDAQAKSVKEMDSRWNESQAGLIEERRAIEESMPQWRQRREELATAMEEPARLLYERVRAKKGGQAVALVESGMCSGCRIKLPLTVVLRARTGQEIVNCSTCGRILYAE